MAGVAGEMAGASPELPRGHGVGVWGHWRVARDAAHPLVPSGQRGEARGHEHDDEAAAGPLATAESRCRAREEARGWGKRSGAHRERDGALGRTGEVETATDLSSG